MNTHTNEKWLHPDSWHRVVDGELSRAELRELVLACEQHPDLWKCCAVAFLEEQTFRLELQELAGNWPATPADAIDVQGTHGERGHLLPADSVCPVGPAASLERGDGGAIARRIEPLKPREASPANWSNHLALAASVVLAFAIGWQACGRFGGDAQLGRNTEAIRNSANEIGAAGNRSIAKPTRAAASASESTNARAGSQLARAAASGTDSLGADSPGTDLVGADLASTEPQAAVSAYAIGQALERPEQFVPLDRRIPKQLAELEQRGLLRIESIEGFVPVRLRDGNTAVVPVQQIDLRPVRNTY